LESECALSYGNISVFSIFLLRHSRPYAIVNHGQGASPRTKSEKLNKPPADEQHATQRITIMAMKKKAKKKKAAKKDKM
jgi:hypothetical protein